jgi:hypothetical protein
MYRDANALGYDLHYTAQLRYKGNEVMFFRPSLNAPKSITSSVAA